MFRCLECRRSLESAESACPGCGGTRLESLSEPDRAESGSRALTMVSLLAVAVLLGAILGPNFLRASARSGGMACRSNLKNLGTALSMWAADHDDRYPSSLDCLTPNYLHVLPICPSAGQNTYSTGYRVSRNRKCFSVDCSGLNHRAFGLQVPNYPRYTSEDGLIDRP